MSARQAAYAGSQAYGGFWIRFVANFIDGLIVSVSLFVFFVALFLLVGLVAGFSGQTVNTSASGGVSTLADLIAFVVYVGYFVYYWGMGQTPAMRLFHLQVADADTGAPIGFSRAGLRYLGFVLSSLVCYIGLIWAAFDSRKQGWHDKIANTVVLQV